MILDLFAGMGGWQVGLAALNADLAATAVGVDSDPVAVATSRAAGHVMLEADIPGLETAGFEELVDGLCVSPPCQDFSYAGKRKGASGERGRLTSEVLRWADALRPEWVACEQTYAALPVWETYAGVLRGWGYSAWCGILNAADFGVPQTRERAVLVASRMREVGAPVPSHSRAAGWVTMSDVLPRGGTCSGAGFRELPLKRNAVGRRAGPNHGHTGWVLRHNQADPERPVNDEGRRPVRGPDGNDFYWRMSVGEPAMTLTQHSSQWRWEHPDLDGVEKITAEEALALQTFPEGYPVQGRTVKIEQFRQIGNAIPPRLATAVLSAATGWPISRAA